MKMLLNQEHLNIQLCKARIEQFGLWQKAFVLNNEHIFVVNDISLSLGCPTTLLKLTDFDRIDSV